MKKFGNQLLILFLLLCIGVFVLVEVLYLQMLFPEINVAAGGDLVLYFLVTAILIGYLIITHIYRLSERLDKVSKASKKPLIAEEELRIVLFKTLLFLILVGFAAPLFVLAIFWVL